MTTLAIATRGHINGSPLSVAADGFLGAVVADILAPVDTLSGGGGVVRRGDAVRTLDIKFGDPEKPKRKQLEIEPYNEDEELCLLLMTRI